MPDSTSPHLSHLKQLLHRVEATTGKGALVSADEVVLTDYYLTR